MNNSRYINSISAFAKILILSNYSKVMAAFGFLMTHVSHNACPFTTMSISIKRINFSRDNMRRLMSRHIFNESVTIVMQHIVVDGDNVFERHSVTSTATFELESDCWQVELDAVKSLSFGVDFADSFDCFGLKFCHAFRLAPCTTSAREKIKKVRQAKK